MVMAAKRVNVEVLVDTIEISTPRGAFTGRAQGAPGGPLALMLHGFPDVPHTFDELGKRLADRGFRAVAPFARGYQPSPPFPLPEEGEQSVFDILGHDVIAITDALSPNTPVALVGHDNGAFTTYYALTERPDRFSRAVTMTAGHPAAVFANTMKMPHQMWKSRYAFLFQVPKISDWLTERHDFRYLRDLWDRWSAPGWEMPPRHWDHVREVMGRSWPAPLQHYREMAFAGPETPISTPTLFISGDRDGCVDSDVSEGQERYFEGRFEHARIADAGHFLHLEKPDVVLPKIVDWIVAGD